MAAASAGLGATDVPVGGGSVALWCRGRGGRTAPKSLTDLKFDDAKQDLDAVVNDPDGRPAPPTSSGTEVPACGHGDLFKFDFASADDVAREVVAGWLTSAPEFASDVAAQGVGVRSYVRSLGAAVLLAETFDPLVGFLRVAAHRRRLDDHCHLRLFFKDSNPPTRTAADSRDDANASSGSDDDSEGEADGVVVAGPPIDVDTVGPGDAVAVRFNSRRGGAKAYGGVVVKIMARSIRVIFCGCGGSETYDVKTERVLTVAP